MALLGACSQKEAVLGFDGRGEGLAQAPHHYFLRVPMDRQASASGQENALSYRVE
jgi:hypothetical protein